MRKQERRSGFTLLELLAVLAIILGLAGLVFGAMGAAKKQARRVKTMGMVKQIADAWTAYHGEYSRFPTRAVTAMDGDALDIMRGGGDNPRSVVFMPLRASTTSINDRWNQAYQVALDDDYDNSVTVPGRSEPLRRQVAVWSLGPDGESGTPDDIASWMEQ